MARPDNDPLKSAVALNSLGINIATFALGRAEKSGEAIAFLGVDEAVSEEALAELASLPQIRQAKALRF